MNIVINDYFFLSLVLDDFLSLLCLDYDLIIIITLFKKNALGKRMNNMKHNYSGGCHCGDVKFVIGGKPVWKVNCYCNWCQTTSGGPFRSFVLFNEENLKFIGQEPKSYEDKNTTHGRPMINQFCSNCGTLIGIKVPSIRERHIAIGALDQRKQIEIDCNIWGTEALNFIAFPDNADVYKTGYWNGTGEKM